MTRNDWNIHMLTRAPFLFFFFSFLSSPRQLSCDMNINTQLGIMNSRMVRTYVAIDPRVRPFAMIIKHWARKRVLNDAGKPEFFLFRCQGVYRSASRLSLIVFFECFN